MATNTKTPPITSPLGFGTGSNITGIYEPPTDVGYDPDERRQLKEYIEALQGGSKKAGDKPSDQMVYAMGVPHYSWTQGAANMLNALRGNMLMNQMLRNRAANAAGIAQEADSATAGTGPGGAPPASPFTGAPPGQAPQPASNQLPTPLPWPTQSTAPGTLPATPPGPSPATTETTPQPPLINAPSSQIVPPPGSTGSPPSPMNQLGPEVTGATPNWPSGIKPPFMGGGGQTIPFPGGSPTRGVTTLPPTPGFGGGAMPKFAPPTSQLYTPSGGIGSSTSTGLESQIAPIGATTAHIPPAVQPPQTNPPLQTAFRGPATSPSNPVTGTSIDPNQFLASGKPFNPSGFGGPTASLAPPQNQGLGIQTPPQAPSIGGANPLLRGLSPIPGGIDRSQIAEVLKNRPDLVERLGHMTWGEVGGTAPYTTQIAQTETALNRAQARGQPLDQILMDRNQNRLLGYYQGGRQGTYSHPFGTSDLNQFKTEVLPQALAGSDYAKEHTGNASGSVAANQYRFHPEQQGFPLPVGGGHNESYFREGPYRNPIPRIPTSGVNQALSGINSPPSAKPPLPPPSAGAGATGMLGVKPPMSMMPAFMPKMPMPTPSFMPMVGGFF